jgi:hypothetical protein
MTLEPVEPGDAFRVTALHFQYVGDRMGAPHVRRIDLHRRAARGFGVGVVAAFLERKRAAR